MIFACSLACHACRAVPLTSQQRQQERERYAALQEESMALLSSCPGCWVENNEGVHEVSPASFLSPLIACVWRAPWQQASISTDSQWYRQSPPAARSQGGRWLEVTLIPLGGGGLSQQQHDNGTTICERLPLLCAALRSVAREATAAGRCLSVWPRRHAGRERGRGHRTTCTNHVYEHTWLVSN
jgi:hypothetical protein